MSSTLDGDSAPSPWVVDLDTMVELRLAAAKRALGKGKFAHALAEAEELLADQPDESKALRIAASAALKMGDATLAALSYEQLHCRFPEDS